jgi:hypothetical protein
MDFVRYRFLLIGVILIFTVGYLWCFINPEEIKGEQHHDFHGLGNDFCLYFFNQTVHIEVPLIFIFIVLLFTILLLTPGKILPGFTFPLIEPPRFLPK